MSEVFALFSGFNLAVFIVVLVLTFLVDTINKKGKSVHGLNIMSVALIVLAVIELFHSMTELNAGFMPWLASNENLQFMSVPLLIIAGLGMIWYFWGISKNIKAYK